MSELQQARQQIQEIDRQMAELFLRRMAAAKEIAAYKQARGLPVEDLRQEERLMDRATALIPDPELRAYYVQFLQDTLAVSKRYQHRLLEGARIAYSGVEGAFAYIAARRIFPDGILVPHASFEEAYQAVAEGDCDSAVLPIENSFAGEVGQVTDLMFAGDLYVNGVYDMQITQNLLGVPGARLEDVKRVLSHPQALSQCRSYLRRRGLEEVSASNTAVAARQVAEAGDIQTAAIASYETAELYGLTVLDHDINESKANTTRFAVFSRAEFDGAGSRDNQTFLLLFSVLDEAGSLAKALNVIGEHGFNMKALRSRPMRNLPWHYYFYVEAEGDDSSEQGKRMIQALSGQCDRLKVVGRYTGVSAT